MRRFDAEAKVSSEENGLRADGRWVPKSARRLSAAAAVRPGDHFEVMTVRIPKIDAASAIVVVDLSGPAAPRISPVVEAAILDPVEDGVEVSFADQEGVVLGPDRALGVSKVERDAVVQLDDIDVAEADRRRPP